MQVLSTQSTHLVSGGENRLTKEGYDASTWLWGMIGIWTTAGSLPLLLPESYLNFFAVRLGAVLVGGAVGYATGAVVYNAKGYLESTVDQYFKPVE